MGLSIGHGIGIPFKKGQSWSSYWTPQYDAVYQAMPTKPTGAIMQSQSKFVKSLVDGGVWAKIDWLSVFQTIADGSLLNWILPGTRNPTATNDAGGTPPAHTAYRGYMGHKVNKSFISTNYNPATHAAQYALNAASMGVYVRFWDQGQTGNLTMGSLVTGCIVGPKYNSNSVIAGKYYGSLNDNNGYATSVTTVIYPGLYAVVRDSATTVKRYRHDVAENVAINSSAIPNAVIKILTVSTYYEISQVGMAWIGGLLDQTDITLMLNAYELYRHEIGDHNVSVIGDSTSAGTGGTAISRLMDSNAYAVSDLAQSGYTIANEKTRWGLMSANYKAFIDVVFVMIGLNDINVSDSATCIAAYQDLINTIRTDIGASNRIVGVTLIPCNRSAFQAWVDLNEAIRGNGATPITGLNAVIDTVATALNDGSNGLAAAYDSGDHIHPNTAGSQLIADLYDAQITAFGL